MEKEKVIIQGNLLFKRGTKNTLEAMETILALGEPAYETDTGKLKIGNGEAQYIDLPYLGDKAEEIDILKKRLDAFLEDADVTESAVDTLKEIQTMINNNTIDLEELVKKIAEFEELHKSINDSIAKIDQKFATAEADRVSIKSKLEATNSALTTKLDNEIARATSAENTVLSEAKAYTDKVKTDILGEDITETFDTLVEIQDWINGDGVNATELTQAIASEASARQAQDEVINAQINNLSAQHKADIDAINIEFEKAYDQQTEVFNNYVADVKAELEEDDRNNLAEAKSYTDSAKSALFGEGSANYDTIVKLSAKTQEIIDTHPTYVAEKIAISETNIKAYLDQKIGEIENGAY